MKTTKEKAEVMLAFDRGEKIESTWGDKNTGWCECGIPVWNWMDCDYRIAEEPKEKIKMLCWTDCVGLIWRPSGHLMAKDCWKRFPAGDVEGEVGE